MQTLTYEQINIPVLLASLRSPITGAMVMFSGEIRNVNKGRGVEYLEYEAYESIAERKIEEIVESAKRKWNLNSALCVHRLGRLDISECAVIVITASMHRSEAYEANQYIIDRVKGEVPIWKKEYFTDGATEWGVNSECSCSDKHSHVSQSPQGI